MSGYDSRSVAEASGSASRISVGVVIPAAGRGRRMGGRRKQYLELRGTPVLLRALAPFLERDDVSAVVVALPAADAAEPPAWLSGADPRLRTVAGGETRTASVRAGLESLPEEVDVVVVHDGARPLLSGEVLDRCIAGAREGWGAVAACPAVDTMKQVDDEGRIVTTTPRSTLWHAQTPQAFPRRMIVDAYGAARGDEAWATDDASLVERRGGDVRVVESPARNLKVTRPEDMARAELYLEMEGE